MTNKNVSVHWSFWVIGVIALIWNLMGAMNFFMQMNASAVSAMPEAYRNIIESRPVWATSAFALAVFGGVLGGFLLLLRKSAATHLFIASLLGAILTMIHFFGISDFGPAEAFIGSSMQLLVTVFLIWYSMLAKRKDWIGLEQ